MYVPFEQLPPQARIWIYQADREFSDAEATEIKQKIIGFVTDWSAHGKALHASGELAHNRFVILGTDANVEAPSGCSIDSSVQFIRSLEQEFKVSLFNRTELAFQEKDQVKTLSLNSLPEAIKSGAITAASLYFDNMADTAGTLQKQWVKPAGESWLRKYF
jgi:hypothetical protein